MRKFFCFLMVLLGVIACSVDASDIPTLEVGQDFTTSNVRVLVLDTFSVKLSTFKFDSINTSESERLLVGKYNDDYLGTIECNSYFELSAATTENATAPYTLPNDATLDSVALILGYDRYFYNDTTLVSHINVHLLSEEVEPDDDAFFNTSTLEYDTIPLVSRRYRPEPFDEDSLHISLPFEFGNNLFQLIQQNDINDNEDLRDNFKGFALVPEKSDNTSVIGFSKESERTYLRFFYSVPEEFEDEERFLDFAINPFPEAPNAFNKIWNTSMDSSLNTLLDQEDELPTSENNDLSYIQSGTGYATKVDFPSIRSIYDIEGTGTVLSALLRIKPLRASHDERTYLRDSLNVNVLDQNNVITQVITTGEGIVIGKITGTNEEFSDVVYEVPVGVFVDQKLHETVITEDALVLFTKDFNQTVDRIILQGEDNRDFEARLEITYAIYDE
ncbi:DUF4270 family protein [Ulvibacterium marinum]|uniref:DUF4270 family protein n=1 Tax=Ulvibacterium marinum TaxID=2419782 RepID=A0A3B0CGZ0_9FLAO|nr:DUF4270 family protein [Ulvibacterium marinum]RKN82306.1 DUF4270 family protein [Ulvibacterium marinum]